MKVFSFFIIFSFFFIYTVSVASNTIEAGSAFFQTENFDDTYYPPCAAPNRVAVTTTTQNPSALKAPFQLRSWLGGMLWGTGQKENNYWVPRSNQWMQENFIQHPAFSSPIMIEYSEPPQNQGSDVNARGINLTIPFPYLVPDAAYDPSCGALNSTWSKAPLMVVADAFKNILLVPTASKPANDGDPVPLPWNPAPNAILVDRMGEYDVDLVFQNPSDPYEKTAAAMGKGTYLKLTQAQGSPFTYVESRGTKYVVIRNFMEVKEATTTAAVVPGVTGVSYFLLGGNQNNPAIFNAGTTLNPSGEQDNFNTWAVFYKTSEVTFTPLTTNNTIEWTNAGASKNYFVVAAIPAVMDYPTTGRTYAAATGAAPTDVKAYAEELGKYAFNFITDTNISYTVTDMHKLETTFTTTLVNPYGMATMVASPDTVFALMPHQYQPVTLDTGVAPDVLIGATDFAPATALGLKYYIPAGNLKTILGTSFTTEYVYNNFLPAMPPPFWSQVITNTAGKTFTSTIGQFLFDNIDNEYISENTDSAFSPWQTAYYKKSKGIYDIGKTLSKTAKELSLLLQFLQASEETPPITFKEQQYNDTGTSKPNRPGKNLPKSLQISVEGSLDAPVYAGVQGAIANNFRKTPDQSIAPPYTLKHFAYYDSEANHVEIFPTSADPSASPFPSRVSNPPAHITGTTQLWEAFGVADMLNDHHYQFGYWIAAAALATMYDGAWNSPPTAGTWGTSAKFGSAIDQLVMDTVYDPSVHSSFYNVAGMSYAPFNFFDRWAGHGWADGLQGTLAGGSGHNENSVLEALQLYSSIILWGMATINDTASRKKILDLGIYLYTTAIYASDLYFYDKNFNLKPGGPSFVPVSTKVGDYPAGTSVWDATIHTANSSGFPKIQQSAVNYSTDFGQTPPNIKFITAFPVAPWTIACGRDPTFMNQFNLSMDTAAFRALISDTATNCWQISYYGNMNMLRGLSGTTQAYGTATSVSPYQFTINLMTDFTPGVPPWGANQKFNDTSQSISEVLHFLHTTDHWGTPDWTLYGHAVAPSSTDTAVFTAAFTKSGTTTYFAFNPTLAEVTVRFFRVIGDVPVGTAFTVPAKRWAKSS